MLRNIAYQSSGQDPRVSRRFSLKPALKPKVKFLLSVVGRLIQEQVIFIFGTLSQQITFFGTKKIIRSFYFLIIV